ncbi:MAG TPA: hypothetical protein VD931_05870 [Baekduia sp.]|nr:hypothetical protein [Baekduia sp.]
MARLVTVLVALGLLVLAPAVQAGPSGFSDAQRVGDGTVSQPAAAVLRDGTAVVAWVQRPGGSRLVVARRDGPSGPWRVRRLDRGSAWVRDVQVALDQQVRGLSVVWAESTRREQRIMAATAPRGGALGAPARAAVVGSATQAGPRLAVLRDGSALLVLRDGARRDRRPSLRVLRRRTGQPRFADVARIERDGVRPAVAADARGAAVLGWSSPARPGDQGRRELRVLRLTGGGRARGRSQQLSGQTTGRVRLVSAPSGDVVASYTGPAPDGLALLRRVVARAGAGLALDPVTSLGAGPAAWRPPAALAVGRAGRAAAAWTLPAQGTTPFQVVHALREPSGTWQRFARPAAPTPMAGDPAVHVWDDAVVAWATARAEPGPATYDVLVARPGGAGEVLGTSVGPDGRGLVVASAGPRALLAWPAAGGGMDVAERG